MLRCRFCGAPGVIQKAIGGYYPTCLGSKDEKCLMRLGTYAVYKRARDAVAAWNKGGEHISALVGAVDAYLKKIDDCGSSKAHRERIVMSAALRKVLRKEYSDA